jgi:hypothetical protein
LAPIARITKRGIPRRRITKIPEPPRRGNPGGPLAQPFGRASKGLIIDEFGFDKIERAEAPQAASLLYKVVDARSEQRSTALVTNIDFGAWGEYLGDPPLAMALLDRIVDGAIILKIAGQSYRAHRAKPGKADTPPHK